MAQACPINYTTVDNTLSRTASLMTAIIVTLFLVTGMPVWLFLLGADLTIRLYGNPNGSFVYRLSALIKRLFHLPTRRVDGAAKKVAGHFGLLFIALLLAASFLQLAATQYVIGIVFLVCLLLDVTINFCAGCKVYHLYRLLRGDA